MYYQEQHAVIKQHVKRTLKITEKQHQKRRGKKEKSTLSLHRDILAHNKTCLQKRA